LVRRGYPYRDAPDPAGAARDGLLCVELQADLERGFAGVQRRLAGQALDHYTLTIGGGYFFVPDLSRGSPF
jgi:deferrochelatase/peroxidase EfeB